MVPIHSTGSGAAPVTSSEQVEVKISPCTPSDRTGRHFALSVQPRSPYQNSSHIYNVTRNS